MMIYGNVQNYEGEWANDKRSGWGRMTYIDGSFYEGEWKAGVRQGEGILLYPNGNLYEGEWQNDMRHGKGRYTHIETGFVQVSTKCQDIQLIVEIPIYTLYCFLT